MRIGIRSVPSTVITNGFEITGKTTIFDKEPVLVRDDPVEMTILVELGWPSKRRFAAAELSFVAEITDSVNVPT